MDEIQAFLDAVRAEAAALTAFAERGAAQVPDIVERLFGCRGRVVVVGAGKCGHVGRKIAATFASTGTPAVFVHPAEALHGDLGFVEKGDVALVLSNSGETTEITEILPHLARLCVPIIALCGRKNTTLCRHSKHVIDTQVDTEADALGMVPTCSTTLMLAVGDALACVLMRKRGFAREDYARFHPGGNLGQKLLCVVEALMHTGKDIPVCHEDVALREALVEVTSKRLGITLAVDDAGKLTGILTDGDIRRTLQRDARPLDLPLRSLMTRPPKTIAPDVLAVEALRRMEDELITVLPVVDGELRPVGVLHIHDLVRVGVA
jgi:arabinose-5-phosphate isomerase